MFQREVFDAAKECLGKLSEDFEGFKVVEGPLSDNDDVEPGTAIVSMEGADLLTALDATSIADAHKTLSPGRGHKWVVHVRLTVIAGTDEAYALTQRCVMEFASLRTVGPPSNNFPVGLRSLQYDPTARYTGQQLPLEVVPVMVSFICQATTEGNLIG